MQRLVQYSFMKEPVYLSGCIMILVDVQASSVCVRVCLVSRIRPSICLRLKLHAVCINGKLAAYHRRSYSELY